MSAKQATPTTTSRSENLRFLHDFQQRSYWESTKVLTSFAAFYLAVTSAALGYVLTRDLKPPFPRLFAITALAFLVLFLLVFSMWARGLLKQVALLDETSRRVDGELYEALCLWGLFAQWRRVNWTAMIATYLAGSVLMGGILFVLLGAG